MVMTHKLRTAVVEPNGEVKGQGPGSDNYVKPSYSSRYWKCMDLKAGLHSQ